MSTDNEIQKELEEISPVLSRLPKITPYIPPTGYFEELPSTILAEINRSRVITMTPRRNIGRFAAAAVVAGTLLLGGWLFMEKRTSVNTLARTNDSSIQKGMQQVSETEMADYVDGSDDAPTEDVTSPAQLRDEDLPLVLADLSDQELQQYLVQETSFTKLN